MRWCRPCWCRTRRSSAPTAASRNWKAGSAPRTDQSGGFLDSMRDAIFGQSQPHGSVPNVRPPEIAQPPGLEQRPGAAAGAVARINTIRAVWPAPGYGQGRMVSAYGGAPQAPMGGGGSFLGTAAAAAAGVVGGSLLLGSIRSMMGGSHHRLRRSGDIGDQRQPKPVERSVRQRPGA